MESKPVGKPMASSPKLTLNSGTSLSDPSEFRRLVGILQYLGFTRLDIAYAVNRLSQFMHRPTQNHWQAAKRVLRYLAGRQLMAYIFPPKTNSPFMPSQMPTGEEILMIMFQLMHTSSTWVVIRSLGQQRNRTV